MTASVADHKASIQLERSRTDEPEQAENALARNQLKECLGLQ